MQTRNGFSLLEMLICVSLILIFASFAVPRFSSATKTAQEAKVQADIRTISNAAALYEIELGYTQSAVSQAVKALERELGTTIIERGKQGVSLTRDGKQYLQFKPLTPDKGEYQIADGVVSADYNNKHFSSDAASPREGEA